MKNLLVKHLLLLFFCFLLSPYLMAQVTNKEVVAKIKTEQVSDIITISGTVASKTQIIKSLRYVMYTYLENLETSNVSRNEQSARFVLQPVESKILSQTTVNENTKDKVTVLLLVYDNDDKLIAKDRVVILNDDEVKPEAKNTSQALKEKDYTGFKGIVTEETKTKPGRDFYIEFYSLYKLKDINGKEIVKIKEQFSFGRNTIMEVFVGRVVVYRFFVQPTRDFILQQSKGAINAVAKYFLKLDQQKSLIKQF